MSDATERALMDIRDMALFPCPYGFLESKVCLTYFLVNTTVSFSANRTLTFGEEFLLFLGNHVHAPSDLHLRRLPRGWGTDLKQDPHAVALESPLVASISGRGSIGAAFLEGQHQRIRF
jgi:hypothetical protein